MRALLKTQLLVDVRAIRNNLERVQDLLEREASVEDVATVFEAIQDDAHAAMNNCDKELSR